ncbi:MAG: PqqD family protein [Candidatus Aenigmarchaeota archaeon]|nr:PqqD family protein [Candidatus Aenigmarchaeota archaeon]MBU5688709.1 PqqD family protein [Candidatus Aenigmarchaeota archaeon]
MSIDIDFEKKPIKSKKLKIISNIGSLYATFDGSRVWEIDQAVNYVLSLCDGNRRIEDIAQEIAKTIESDIEVVRQTLASMMLELEKNGFIEYL